MLDQDEATENNEDMLSGSDPPPESTVLNTGTVIFRINCKNDTNHIYAYS